MKKKIPQEIKTIIRTMVGRHGALKGTLVGTAIGAVYGLVKIVALHQHPLFVVEEMFAFACRGAGLGMAVGAVFVEGLTAVFRRTVEKVRTSSCRRSVLQLHTYWQTKRHKPPRLLSTILLGIVAPVFCLVVDPAVFRRSYFDMGFGGSLSSFQAFAYVASAMGIIGLLLWLIIHRRESRWSSFLAGLLFAGALFAFRIGYAILPLTLFGALTIVALLGFLPFGVAAIFFINALRAFRDSSMKYTMRRRLGIAAFGVILFFTIPGLAQWRISQIGSHFVRTVFEEKAPVSEEALQQFKRVSWCANAYVEILLKGYEYEAEQSQKDDIATLYRDITGEEIDGISAYRVD